MSSMKKISIIFAMTVALSVFASVAWSAGYLTFYGPDAQAVWSAIQAGSGYRVPSTKQFLPNGQVYITFRYVKHIVGVDYERDGRVRALVAEMSEEVDPKNPQLSFDPALASQIALAQSRVNQVQNALNAWYDYANRRVPQVFQQMMANPKNRWGYDNDPNYRASWDRWLFEARQHAQSNIAALERQKLDLIGWLNKNQIPGTSPGTLPPGAPAPMPGPQVAPPPQVISQPRPQPLPSSPQQPGLLGQEWQR